MPTKICPSDCSGGRHFAKRRQRYDFFAEFRSSSAKKIAEIKKNDEFISSFGVFFVILHPNLDY